MAEEKTVRFPGVEHDPGPNDWEDEIIDAPREAPRKAVWVPLDTGTRHWYISRERRVHNLVNAVLREYIEAEMSKGKTSGTRE